MCGKELLPPDTVFSREELAACGVVLEDGFPGMTTLKSDDCSGPALLASSALSFISMARILSSLLILDPPDDEDCNDQAIPKINTVLIGYSDWPPSTGLRSL